MHQAFNFDFLQTDWRADDLREAITKSFDAMDAVGAPATWVLSNHDVVRHASRLGLPPGSSRLNGIGVGDPQPDAVLGLRRARAATALMLALPGSAYLYQGEELGLPDSTDLPDDARQDPTWTRSGFTERAGTRPNSDALGRGQPVIRLRPLWPDLAAATRFVPGPCRRPAGGRGGNDPRAVSRDAGPAPRARLGAGSLHLVEATTGTSWPSSTSLPREARRSSSPTSARSRWRSPRAPGSWSRAVP